MEAAAFPRRLLAICLLLCPNVFVICRLTEEGRLEEFQRRGHTWPPEWQPKTRGWHERMEQRARQLEANPHHQEKWDGYIALMYSGLLTTNFTRLGFHKTRAPKELYLDVLRFIASSIGNMGGGGVSQQIPELFDEQVANFYSREVPLPPAEEHPKQLIGVIRGPKRPTFARSYSLTNRLLEELKGLHEQWSGEELDPVISYGFRYYHNESQLLMHVDKVHDHVISSIFHIDHSVDSEPWPLLIEGFDGNLYEVTLEPGELLFYESAKCMHGRPRVLNGSWYTSVFTHYKPKGWSMTTEDAIFAIPEGWRTVKDHSDLGLPELSLVGTGFLEPCKGELANWCTEATPLVRKKAESAELRAVRDREREQAKARKRELQERFADHARAKQRAAEEPDLRGNPKRVLSYSEHESPKALQLSDNQSGWILLIALLLVVTVAARATKGKESKKAL